MQKYHASPPSSLLPAIALGARETRVSSKRYTHLITQPQPSIESRVVYVKSPEKFKLSWSQGPGRSSQCCGLQDAFGTIRISGPEFVHSPFFSRGFDPSGAHSLAILDDGKPNGLSRGMRSAFRERSAALIALYRARAAARAFDPKAIALQRTGKIGTFASALGQEARYRGGDRHRQRRYRPRGKRCGSYDPAHQSDRRRLLRRA